MNGTKPDTDTEISSHVRKDENSRGWRMRKMNLQMLQWLFDTFWNHVNSYGACVKKTSA